MNLRRMTAAVSIGFALILSGCQKNIFQTPTIAPATLRDVPALRLNFRYEPDVPAPTENKQNAPTEERNAAIQADFDRSRPQELLDMTLSSPDKQRVLAAYHRAGDLGAEFRLDMYSADGRLLRKITPDSMAVHFPDAIVWSPDSATLAFVAMTRAAGTAPSAAPPPSDQNGATNSAETNAAGTNSTATTNANAQTNQTADANSAAPAAPTPAAPTGVLTFRTEQIYVCGADGDNVKPVTQNEGLIYFYYVWSPDSSMLIALAATYREWQFLQYQADSKGEAFTPQGRPRLVEKSGRERRLDDALTAVRPVWSPDSSKVAVAFDKQIRIYDSIGNNPTQAAIPLRNQLLLSSQLFDRDLIAKDAANSANGAPANAANSAANGATTANNANTNANSNQPNANQPPADQWATTLPEESTLVSFNPIISIEWTTDEMLYFQTGYVKRMKNDAESVRSYLRWHRLILSPQPVSLGGGSSQ